MKITKEQSIASGGVVDETVVMDVERSVALQMFHVIADALGAALCVEALLDRGLMLRDDPKAINLAKELYEGYLQDADEYKQHPEWRCK